LIKVTFDLGKVI